MARHETIEDQDAGDLAGADGDGADGGGETASDDNAGGQAAPGENRQSRRWYRLAFLLTAVLVIAVLVALPFAFQSMYSTLFGSLPDVVYDLETGRALSAAEVDAHDQDRTYLNIAFSDVDVGNGTASLIVYGHRECVGDTCPDLTLNLLALDHLAVGRQGTQPSATIEIVDPVTVFTEELQLPISGNPSLYPFDDYMMRLAVTGFQTEPDGTLVPLTRDEFDDHLVVTVQDQIAKLVMQPPIAFDLAEIEDESDLLEEIAGQQLDFVRPVYLQVLTGLLVLLIGVSGALSLLTRSINDLLLGIGGLILGVWGIRSVMVPQPLPSLSLVDMALSAVILCLLIGLAIRAALYFRHQSELNLFQRRNRER